jgi:peptidoglycan/LPS O-acetylase OafA/YrhL
MFHAGFVEGTAVYMVAFFPLIYAMSAVLYAVVEVPAKRWLRRALVASRPSRAIASPSA